MARSAVSFNIADKGALGVICSLCLAGMAQAHMATNWVYPRECCHNTDCALVSEDMLIYDASKDTYKIKGIPGETFVNPHEKIPEADGHHGWLIRNWRWSGDDKFHRCASPLADQSAKHTFCLFVPRSFSREASPQRYAWR